MRSLRKSIRSAVKSADTRTCFGGLPRRAVLSILATAALPPRLRAKEELPVVRYVDVPAQDWLPFWVAQQNGFDKRYGVEFKPVPIVGGTETAEYAAAGNSDIATLAGVLALLAVKRGLIPNKIKLLCPVGSICNPQHPFAGIVASAAIKNWKDLEGKNVAVHGIHTMFYLAVAERLDREHVDVKKINFIQIPLPQQVDALKAERVDAICVGTDLAARAIHDKIGHLLDWVIGKPPFDSYSTGYLVVNSQFADGHPVILENFLKAYITAIKWIDDNPGEAKDVTAKQLHITDPEIVKAFYLQQWDPTLSPSPQSVTLDNEMMKDQGVPQPIDLDQYLTLMKLVADARRAVLDK
jgi:NitT/TauT family transport system substrate-binding protein